MELFHLTVILEIAKAKSISQAADNLLLSQPYVSKVLKSIEAETGKAIFERNKAGVVPTPFGKRFLYKAREIAYQMRELADLYGQDDTIPMELKICSEGFLFINQVIVDIYERSKKMSVNYQINEGSKDFVIHNVADGSAEIGFIVIDEVCKRKVMSKLRALNLEGNYFCDAYSGVYVSSKSKIIPKDMKVFDVSYAEKMPFVCIDELENGSMTAPKNYLKEHNINPRNVIRVGNRGLRNELVASLDGFGEASYCRDIYSRTEFESQIRFLPYTIDDSNRCAIYYIQQKNHMRTPLADSLIAALQEMSEKPFGNYYE